MREFVLEVAGNGVTDAGEEGMRVGDGRNRLFDCGRGWLMELEHGTSMPV